MNIIKVIDGYLSNGKFYKDLTYNTEITGQKDNIYVDRYANKTYMYDDSKYIQITSSSSLDNNTLHLIDNPTHNTITVTAGTDIGSATLRYHNDCVTTTCRIESRHRRIYKRKLTHCTCCNGLLPPMECNDSTELKCPYCDSMQDAVEIIDEEY